MKTSVKRLGMAVFLATLPIVASEGIAGTLDVTFNGVDPNRSLNVSHTGTTAEPSTTQAGVFNWTQNSYKNQFEGGTGQRSWENTSNIAIDSFCLELTQYVATSTVYLTTENISIAPTPGNPDGPMGTTNAHYLNQLWNNVFTANDFNTQTNLFQFNAGAALSSDDAKNKAAAVQLAIWEIVNDNGLDLTSGAFTGGGNNLTVRNLAQGYLDALNLGGYTASWQLVALTSTARQDQVTAVRISSISSVPGIPSPVAAGMGLIGFVMLGFRRQREII